MKSLSIAGLANVITNPSSLKEKLIAASGSRQQKS
jgi:hypothetical protein